MKVETFQSGQAPAVVFVDPYDIERPGDLTFSIDNDMGDKRLRIEGTPEEFEVLASACLDAANLGNSLRGGFGE